MEQEQPVPGTEEQEERPRGFLAWLRHAFAIEEFSEASLSEDEKAVLARIAQIIHRRGMGSPAILWIESNRHLNFFGSQALKVMEPIHDLSYEFVNWLMQRLGVGYVSPEELTKFQSALEKRYSIEYLLQQIEKEVAGGPAGEAPADSGTASPD